MSKSPHRESVNASGDTPRVVVAEFLRSVVDPEGLPTDRLPEVAFIGRSNAGKSSLLNALVQVRSLARTSGTPGRTQAVNYFSVEMMRGEGEARQRGQLLLADFPGYGFAKVGQKQRESWGEWLFAALTDRASVRKVFLLLDIRRSIEEEEEMILESLTAREVILVLTKADALSRVDALQRRDELAKTLPGRAKVYLSALEGKHRFDDDRLRCELGQVIAEWHPDPKRPREPQAIKRK